MGTGDPNYCFEHKQPTWVCAMWNHKWWEGLVKDATGYADDAGYPADQNPQGFVVKDSGERQEFETGSRRDTRVGKGRFDLLPTLPMRELALHYEQGATKYGDHNWKKGQPLMRYVDSAMRHINALVAGENTENHAIAAAWNMFSYRWTLAEIEAGRLPKTLDDRPEVEPRFLLSEPRK